MDLDNFQNDLITLLAVDNPKLGEFQREMENFILFDNQLIGLGTSEGKSVTPDVQERKKKQFFSSKMI